MTAAVITHAPADAAPADDAEPGTAFVVSIGDVPPDAVTAAAQGVARPAPAGDPYAAVVLAGRLARDGHEVAAVVISLASLRRGEASVIRTLRRYHPSAQILVTRPTAGATTLAEAILHGADALIAGGEIHPFHDAPPDPPEQRPVPAPARPAPEAPGDVAGGPLLSGAELKALLEDYDDDDSAEE